MQQNKNEQHRIGAQNGKNEMKLRNGSCAYFYIFEADRFVQT